MKRITVSVAARLLLGGLAGMLLLAACSEADDASRIAQRIASMQDGIEDKRTGPVLEVLAEDFRTSEGQPRREMLGLMLYHFRRYPNISVVARNQTIRVAGEQAEVTLEAWLLGGETVVPERGQRYQVSMRWQKTAAGDWQLARLKWQKQTE